MKRASFVLMTRVLAAAATQLQGQDRERRSEHAQDIDEVVGAPVS